MLKLKNFTVVSSKATIEYAWSENGEESVKFKVTVAIRVGEIFRQATSDGDDLSRALFLALKKALSVDFPYQIDHLWYRKNAAQMVSIAKRVDHQISELLA